MRRASSCPDCCATLRRPKTRKRTNEKDASRMHALSLAPPTVSLSLLLASLVRPKKEIRAKTVRRGVGNSFRSIKREEGGGKRYKDSPHARPACGHSLFPFRSFLTRARTQGPVFFVRAGTSATGVCRHATLARALLSSASGMYTRRTPPLSDVTYFVLFLFV